MATKGWRQVNSQVPRSRTYKYRYLAEGYASLGAKSLRPPGRAGSFNRPHVWDSLWLGRASCQDAPSGVQIVRSLAALICLSGVRFRSAYVAPWTHMRLRRTRPRRNRPQHSASAVRAASCARLFLYARPVRGDGPLDVLVRPPVQSPDTLCVRRLRIPVYRLPRVQIAETGNDANSSGGVEINNRR